MAERRKKRRANELGQGRMKKPVNPSVLGTAKQADRVEKGGRRRYPGRPEGAGQPGGHGRGGKTSRGSR